MHIKVKFRKRTVIDFRMISRNKNKNKALRSKIVLVHNEENVNRFLACRSPHAPEYKRQIQYNSTQNIT